MSIFTVLGNFIGNFPEQRVGFPIRKRDMNDLILTYLKGVVADELEQP